MMNRTKQFCLIKLLIINFSLLIINCSFAGPPFNTDDPETVDFRHWEFYMSSMSTFTRDIYQGTLPHFEVNYGVVENVQLHAIFPLNYNYISHSTINNENSFNYGYGYTELGVKYRFVKETDNTPQIGVFPIIEVPTVTNNEFTNAKLQVLLPIWLQKSFVKFTTYGGGGYWFNPGSGNRNWYFLGWEGQYDLSKTFTVGGEIFYHSPQAINAKSSTFFNLGGFINFSENLHFIFSTGHSISGTNTTIAYGGLLVTI